MVLRFPLSAINRWVGDERGQRSHFFRFIPSTPYTIQHFPPLQSNTYPILAAEVSFFIEGDLICFVTFLHVYSIFPSELIRMPSFFLTVTSIYYTFVILITFKKKRTLWESAQQTPVNQDLVQLLFFSQPSPLFWEPFYF